MRRLIFVALSFFGSAFLLWLVLRDVPFAEVMAGIQQADVVWLIITFVFITLSLTTRGVRWRALVENRVPPREAFLLMSVTMMLNQLPLRAGEVARSAIATRYDVPFFTSLTTIVIERILDLLAVVIVISFALPLAPGATPEAGRAALTLGAAALVGFVVLIFFARRPQVPRAILATLNRWVPLLERLPLARLLENVLQGLQPLTRWHRFAHAVGWTTIAWVVSFLSLYTLARALALPPESWWLVAFLGVGFTAIGLALPLSVASLGPFQAALAFAGQLLLLDPVTAITLGFLFNGMAVLGYVFWGTIGLFSLGLSLGDVFSAQPQPAPAPTPD